MRKLLPRPIAVMALLAVGPLGCAARGAGAAGQRIPATGPERAAATALEREAVDTTAPDRPLRIRFDWSLRDRDARFEGRGAARVEPPYRARLDLFGPRGESYLSAVLVGGEIRLPPASRDAPVPPPALLWSTLGMVRPPAGARLVGATERDGRVRLAYAAGGSRWSFELQDGRLRHAEWVPADGGRHTVDLEGESRFGRPGRAVYRDWAAFRELILMLEEIDHVEPFPPGIWTPGTL